MTRRSPAEAGPVGELGSTTDVQSTAVGNIPGDLLPGVTRRLQNAARSLLHGIPLCCLHLAHVSAGLCSAHPAAGLLCPACFAQHRDRHSWMVEAKCSACGQMSELMHDVIAQWPVSIVAQTTTGLGLQYSDVVTFAGCGVCPRCAAAAGLIDQGVAPWL